jgi:LmbE family N-acetylglucosaminyl deacetylase
LVWESPPAGSVLVLAPHPDDEAIGCGGALIRHARQGDRVRVIFVTDGAAGDPLDFYAGLDYGELRREEARRAAEVLGVEEVAFWDYPDGRLAEAQGLAERLARLLKADPPSVLYSPSAREVHPDHWAVAVALQRALRDASTPPIVCRYEIWAAIEPTHLIDITALWNEKRKAVEQYQSQLRYNDYLHIIGGLNAHRSIYLNTARYVEAFQVGTVS